MKTLSEFDVPCALVQDYHSALTEDPQIKRNGTVLHFSRPTAGEMTNLANPVVMLGTPAAVRRPPPLLGEHAETFHQHGFSTQEVAGLLAAGVVLVAADWASHCRIGVISTRRWFGSNPWTDRIQGVITRHSSTSRARTMNVLEANS